MSKPDGEFAALLKRLDFPANSRLLVFAGRPAREKNIDSMVAAVERLGDPFHHRRLACAQIAAKQDHTRIAQQRRKFRA